VRALNDGGNDQFYIKTKMDRSSTTPTDYIFRICGEDVASGAVVIINPLSSSRTNENDPALGPQSVGQVCATCVQGITKCPGHSGAIKIYPSLVPLAGKNPVSWLMSVCAHCGRIGLSNEERASIQRRKGSFTFKDIQTALLTKSHDYLCPFCNQPFQVLRPVGFWTGAGYDYTFPALFFIDFPGKKKGGMDGKGGYHEMRIADNYYVWNILRRATAEDCKLIGWNYGLYHPRNFMSDHVPIAPIAARPKPSSSQRFIGGKTHKFYDLISRYQILIGTALGGRTIPQAQKDMVHEPQTFNELIMNIFYLYYVIITLQARLPDHLTAAVTKEFHLGAQKGMSFVEVLRRKKGFFRKFVASSRHDVNIRTPLTGYTYGAIGTATCPRDYAMKICVPQKVTPENIELMRSLVRNGPRIYPGANSYDRAGVRFNLTGKDLETVASSLIPGDVIYRHVLTGDLALHQRYPSIREESIDTVMLVVTDDKLVKIPLATCAKKMADFDGDDTELFFLSSFGVAMEAFLLSSLPRQFIAPTDGLPSIGIGGEAGTDVQAGINLLRRTGRLSQLDINALFVSAFTDVPAPKGKSEYSFNDIISALLPVDFYYDAKANGDSPIGELVIEGGEIVKGEVTTKGFEMGTGYLLKSLALNTDSYTAIKVLEDVTRIAYKAINLKGWSIADDTRLIEPFRSKIADLVADRVRKINECVNQFHRGRLTIPVGQDPLDYFERRITVNLAFEHAQELWAIISEMLKGTSFEHFGYINAFRPRLMLALATRGQMMDEGHRLRPRLCDGTRHSVWFPRSYDGAEAGGYIISPYIAKLKPYEHFYEAIPSRAEVFTKGVKLQEQGYYNRKVSTSLGPVHIGYLGEVRGHSDSILDFYYGHIGADSHCAVGVVIDAHIIGEKEFEQRYGGRDGHNEEMTLLRSIVKDWREAIADYARVTSDEKFSPINTRFESPVDLHALLKRYQPGKGTQWKRTNEKMGMPASPDEVWRLLKGMDERFIRTHIGKRAGPFMRRIAACKVNAFMRVFRFICHVSRFTTERWSVADIQEVLGVILFRYGMALCPVGDMVGLKAELNIIAPQTQAQLHAIRGGKEQKGTTSIIKRVHGTKLFREKTEGLTTKHPISAFMLQGSLRESLSECLDFAKRISSVRLEDVLIRATFFSISPAEIEKTNDCGMDKFKTYFKSLTPTARKYFERTRRSWFYIYLHIDSFRLLINKAEVSMVGKRIQSQFSDVIEAAIPIYENKDGLHIFLAMKPELTIDHMRSHFEAIIGKGIVHGHPSFSNGTVIEYSGIPETLPDGSMTAKKAYKILLNGCNLPYLFSLREIDKTTITSSHIPNTAQFFGIEEARFRIYEELSFECSQMEDLVKLLRRHLKVFIDYVAYRGNLTFVPRFAVGSNPDVDDLDLMTFETADIFLERSIERAEWHPIRAITPCALYGLSPPFGSSMSDVRIRVDDLYMKRDSSAIDGIMDKMGAKPKRRDEIVETTKMASTVVPIPINTAAADAAIDWPDF